MRRNSWEKSEQKPSGDCQKTPADSVHPQEVPSEFDREGGPTGAPLLCLGVAHHLEGAANQLLAEVHHGAFHEGQAVHIHHHTGATLFKHPAEKQRNYALIVPQS